MDISLIILFVPTILLISITPGMCMTLAMTLGMSIGVKRTTWMMLGELCGVSIVVIAAAAGVTTIMLEYPVVFAIFKFVGATYLIYLGMSMWRAKSKFSIDANNLSQHQNTSRGTLFNQGLITAISNPKGWAFMASLLPTFINTSDNLTPQISALLVVILCSELICMTLYASGGKTLGVLLMRRNNLSLLNKISGSLMITVGIWLGLS